MKTRILLAVVTSAIMALSVTNMALAEEREKINKVNLSVKSYITSGSFNTEVDISAGETDYYSVDSYEVVNDNLDKWSQYDSPRIKIQLIANDGYYFKSESKSSISLKGDDVYQFVEADRFDDNSYMEVVVDLKPIGGKLGNPNGLKWGTNCRAEWSKGYKANGYDVELYGEDDKRIKSVSIIGTSYDFGADMTENGDYYFKVRSTKKEDKKSTLSSDWLSSDYYDSYELTTARKNTTQSTSSGNGTSSSAQTGWVKNSVGWWYRYADGAWPATTWSQIDGQWYYFGNDGYMKIGWQDIGGRWYYLGDSGAMYANTNTPDGYQVGQDGALIH